MQRREELRALRRRGRKGRHHFPNRISGRVEQRADVHAPKISSASAELARTPASLTRRFHLPNESDTYPLTRYYSSQRGRVAELGTAEQRTPALEGTFLQESITPNMRYLGSGPKEETGRTRLLGDLRTASTPQALSRICTAYMQSCNRQQRPSAAHSQVLSCPLQLTGRWLRRGRWTRSDTQLRSYNI